MEGIGMALSYEETTTVEVSRHVSGGGATVAIFAGRALIEFSLNAREFDEWREAFGYEV